MARSRYTVNLQYMNRGDMVKVNRTVWDLKVDLEVDLKPGRTVSLDCNGRSILGRPRGQK